MGSRTTRISASNFTQNEKGPQIPQLCVWSLGDKMERLKEVTAETKQRNLKDAVVILACHPLGSY